MNKATVKTNKQLWTVPFDYVELIPTIQERPDDFMKQSKNDPKSATMFANSRGHSAALSRPSAAAPSHDEIAMRAYEIYEKKDHLQGQCKQNWQQAEHELGTQSMSVRSSS